MFKWSTDIDMNIFKYEMKITKKGKTRFFMDILSDKKDNEKLKIIFFFIWGFQNPCVTRSTENMGQKR